jgi:hypothetical protein
VNYSTNHCVIDNILGKWKKLLYDSIDFKYFGWKVILSKTIMEEAPKCRQFLYQDFGYCSKRNTCHVADPFNHGISFPCTLNGTMEHPKLKTIFSIKQL